MIRRQITRFVRLSTYFEAQLAEYGWIHAVRSSWTQLIIPYVRRRALYFAQWLAPTGGASEKGRGVGFSRLKGPIKPGVLFVGYAEGALGLGQAFRANLRAAASAGVDFAIFPFRRNIETRLIDPFMREKYDEENTYAVNVIQVATDQIPLVIEELGCKSVDESYNILYTYWELSRAPEEWRQFLEKIQEIWVPNQFVAESFSEIFDGTIIIIPPAIENISPVCVDRGGYGMKNDKFYFLFSFDYYSSAYRKNPLGVLDAFGRAFPLGSEPVGLVIKSTGNSDHVPEIKSAIFDACQRDDRVLYLDKSMPRYRMEGLLQACDAYISLHRAEGFGLGMAEALMLDKIVIGTDYSGSRDFLSVDTGYPVPYTLRPLASHEYPWATGQVWAEPDVAAAADLMRRAVKQRNEAKIKSQIGRELVKTRYDVNRVGLLMKKRIDDICEMLELDMKDR
ncbi:hypothetical protein ACERNI_17930 [Camelimonas sp. ID_303_24]